MDFGKFATQQRPQIVPEDGEPVMKKVVPVRLKDYIKVRLVVSLIHYFYVKEGLYGVRKVYNGTVCGLNDNIWGMHFGLPTVRHTLRSLLPCYFQTTLSCREA